MAKLFERPKQVNRVLLLETGLIRANAAQPRKQFEEEGIQELAQSIRENGLLQPIVVRRDSAGGYELIAGERRLRAFRLLGRAQIPAIIEEADRQRSAVLALIENTQRRDLNCFEQAEAMLRLIEEGRMSQQELARRLGKAQSTVANKLRILRFSPALRQTMLAAGLTERHIRALLPLSEEQAGRLAEEIARRGLTVKETEVLVEETLAPRPKREAPRFFIQDIRLLLNTIEKAVGRVKEAGLPIEASRSEEGEELVLTVRIPKKAAYRTSRHSA